MLQNLKPKSLGRRCLMAEKMLSKKEILYHQDITIKALWHWDNMKTHCTRLSFAISIWKICFERTRPSLELWLKCLMTGKISRELPTDYFGILKIWEFVARKSYKNVWLLLISIHYWKDTSYNPVLDIIYWLIEIVHNKLVQINQFLSIGEIICFVS